MRVCSSSSTMEFQPTLPARGATGTIPVEFTAHQDISTHAPRTGSDKGSQHIWSSLSTFQPTLPARGATRWRSCCGRMALFQPTLPARGATCWEHTIHFIPRISTHAPRTGSDWERVGMGADRTDFNPRSPHGERLRWWGRDGRRGGFQPTLPARGATSAAQNDLPAAQISTHAPRTGSDE